jgi:hypothetical protein
MGQVAVRTADNKFRSPAIARYITERNAMLMKRDPDALSAFMRSHGLRVPSCREAAEVTLHKTITGVVSLPLEIRKASKAWLTERGYHSLDDGDLG